MKTYKIDLMTTAGIKTEIYTDDPNKPEFETLREFENRMIAKYGTFIMIKAVEI